LAYDEAIAGRIRELFPTAGEVTEKKMFGGIAFMLRGNMCCGVIGDKLMLRVGADGHEGALRLPHAREMDFTGKPMKGFIYVDPAGFRSGKSLKRWVDMAVKYARSLPAK
jgi:TfoX/Sxy family transcriptional regulator of competence genes